ncbi:MAG: ATPase [Oscillospiraceae bacterium]|nr:ATPase [Oscillospiraceae bacterium]
MKVEDLINELEDMMNEAKVLPLTGGKAVVDTETVLDILDEIQEALPTEISHAKAIVADRKQILSGAKKEAEEIVRKGEEKRRALVEQSEIVKQAEAQANEIIADAKKKASEIKRGASDYVDNIMKETDDTLTDIINEVRKTRQSIKSSKRN